MAEVEQFDGSSGPKTWHRWYRRMDVVISTSRHPLSTILGQLQH
ncbi:hypothetical protein ACQCT5_06880 [Sutcliffiella halmapala]